MSGEGRSDPDGAERSLWSWAVALYERPGVADALLALQERSGVDVVLALWRIWLWDTRRRVDPDTEARAIALSASWSAQVVGPLRAARNALKAAPAGLAQRGEAQALRRSILDAELAAERLQLEALERLSGPADAGAQRCGLAAWLGSLPPLRNAGGVDTSALAAAVESGLAFTNQASSAKMQRSSEGGSDG